jgi:uncharacterized protein (TIGR02099 family)
MILRRTFKILLLVAAGFAALTLLLMLALKLALDRAPQYQAQIKDWVYRRTGYHIAFAHVWPAFRWYGPELYFDGLELRSPDDRRVLARAAGGRIGADIWQLLQNGKLFALRVELDAPTLAIARLGPSRFALASEIVWGGAAGSVSQTALNDLPAGTLIIRRGVVVVEGWNAALPRLELRDVDFDATRVAHFVSASLSAQLPEQLGGRLRVSGTARGAERIAELRWNVLASASGMHFPGWRELLPDYLTRLDGGTGAFQALVSGRGADVERANLEFSASGVVVRLAESPNAVMDQVSGALTLAHTADRWTLSGRRLRAVSAGRQDPDSEFEASWRENAAGMLDLHAEANYLRAETLLPLVGLMPQKDIRERLRDLAPTGEWSDMRLTLARASASEAWRFDARAKFRDMGFAPVGRAPGLRGLSGSLVGTEAAGHLIIDTHAAVYNWPDQFPQPIALSLFKSTLYWRRDPRELLLATSDLALRTHGGSLHAKLAWSQPADGSSPVLTVASSIDDGIVADAPLYFPHLLLPPPALQWLDRAFVAGHLPHAAAVFTGPVRHFPFRDGTGLFLVRFSVDHVTLDYRQDWPRLENVAAQGEFRNQGLSVQVASALAGPLKVDSGNVRFVDFKNGEMEVHAAAHGDAADALGYLAATPLDALAEGGFSSVEGSGALRCGVDLFFPFKQFDARRVLVHVDLHDATLRRRGASVAATDIAGGADIDGAQVVRADLRGQLLGGPFQMTARTPRSRAAMRTQLEFRGTLTGAALHEALGLSGAMAIDGQTDWRGVLRMSPEPARERSLHLASSLAGIELGLPAPLHKAAAASLPATVDVQWPAPAVTQLKVMLGTVVRSEVSLDDDPSGIKVSRATVWFGGGEPLAADGPGLTIGGQIDELDLAGWLDLSASAKPDKPLSSYLHAAKLTLGRVDYHAASLRDVTLGLAADPGGWRVAFEGPNASGWMALPGPDDPQAPWDLEFERLKFVDAAAVDAAAVDAATPVDGAAANAAAAAAAGGNTAAAAADSAPPAPQHAAEKTPSLDPRTLPAVRFHAGELAWGDRQFGEVRATVVKLEDGVSLKELTATSASYGAHATGEWRVSGSGLKGLITSYDVGETMKQLGFAAVLEAKSGDLEFDLSWPGAPTDEALSQAAGHVRVSLGKGQIVGLKPGAGRVLGLASFSELPRRLALDFSDVTDKGFAFDTVRGDFELRDGSAYTDDVVVKGPAAEIGLIGRVGLKNKDYDQTAVVTGNVSSTLALPAFAAGPIVGGAALLFTQLFKQPLKGLVRGYYRITGTWDNPTVERIKSADAPTATAEAPKL